MLFEGLLRRKMDARVKPGMTRVVAGWLKQLRSPQLANLTLIKSPHDLFAAPCRGVALDPEQIVGRRGNRPVRDRRCRWYADRRDFAARAVEPHRGMDVIVAVQD